MLCNPDAGNELGYVADGTSEGSGLQLVLDDGTVNGLSEGTQLKVVAGSPHGVDDGLDDGVRHDGSAEASAKLGAAVGMPLGARLAPRNARIKEAAAVFRLSLVEFRKILRLRDETKFCSVFVRLFGTNRKQGQKRGGGVLYTFGGWLQTARLQQNVHPWCANAVGVARVHHARCVALGSP